MIISFGTKNYSELKVFLYRKINRFLISTLKLKLKFSMNIKPLQTNSGYIKRCRQSSLYTVKILGHSSLFQNIPVCFIRENIVLILTCIECFNVKKTFRSWIKNKASIGMPAFNDYLVANGP